MEENIRKNKNSKLRLALISIIFLSLMVIAAVSVKVLFIIEEINLTKVVNKLKSTNVKYEKKYFLDESTLVRDSDLRTFWAWSDSYVGFDEFVKNGVETGRLEKHPKGLFIKESIALPNLSANDCKSISYCLQNKYHFAEIPSLLWKGLIGVEDYRFLDHKGVDPKSLARALWHDIKVMRFDQGGSTLTQQLVKNIFFSNEKKISRKLKELVASIYIEFKLSKEEILQSYFNEIVWGSLQGIRLKGVAAASMGYFLKRPSELTPFETSILIGLLKGPYYYSPINHLERLKERTGVVFNKLKELKMFATGAKSWDEKKWSSWHENLKKRNSEIDLRSIYIITNNQEQSQSFDHFIFIKEVESLKKELKEKYPKLDLAIKTKVWELSENNFEEKFSHYSKVERKKSLAFKNERHQVGSTLKPIIIGQLVENGIPLDYEVEAGPITLKLKSGNWSPKESHKVEVEKISLKETLIQSLNRPIIRSVQEYGFDKFENIIKDKIPHLNSPLSQYPAQLLGAVELSLDELGKIYSDFLINNCKNPNAKAQEVIMALADPSLTTVRYRVGELLGQLNFFGKTGTSNNGFDNWFVAFDGKELHITWVGLETGRNESKELKIYGSNTAFVIYKNYVERRGKLFNELICHQESGFINDD